MFPVIFSKTENTKSTITKQRCYEKTHLNTLNLKYALFQTVAITVFVLKF